MNQIPLYNIKKEIIAYAIVDAEDYDKCIKIRWYLTNYEYACNSEGDLMHRFLLNATIDDPLIDHRDRNKLNNTKINISFSTPSQNTHNRPKKDNASSKYIGVSKYGNKWKCSLSKNNIHYTKVFKEETWAAYYYDILAKKYYGDGANLNNIEKPLDYIEPVFKEKRELPTGVTLTKSGKYRVNIIYNNQHIYLGEYDNVEVAAKKYIDKKLELKKAENDYIKSKEINRNKDGNPILVLKYGNTTKECLVSEQDYYDLKQYSWYVASDGYVHGTVNCIPVKMHRFIMKPETKNDKVDHINHDKTDNRRSNLRICDDVLNAHNRSSDGYRGIYLIDSNKYAASISKNGITYYLGSYELEIDAVRAYDRKATELYGNNANLNLPHEDNRSFEYIIKKKTTIYRGVSKSNTKFRVDITIDKKKCYFGTFDTELEAAKVYNNEVINRKLDRKLNIIPDMIV